MENQIYIDRLSQIAFLVKCRHMNKKESEKYAYSILRALLNNFPEMNHVDLPDYSSDRVGLEITKALLPEDGEYAAFLEQFMNKPYSSIPKKRLTSLGFNDEPSYNRDINCLVHRSENGISLYYSYMPETNDYVLSCAVGRVRDRNDLVTVIKGAVSDKLMKLNRNYVQKETNYLALIIEKTADFKTMSDNLLDSELNILRKVIYDLYKDSEDLKYHYDSVYVIFWDVLIVISSTDWSCQTKYISDELRYTTLKQILNF